MKRAIDAAVSITENVVNNAPWPIGLAVLLAVYVIAVPLIILDRH